MTDKAVDDWMAFYIGKYLADTMHLAREQHGSYLLLIMAAFKNAGWLPNDDGLLAQIAKCTPREWKAERATYARFFELTDERWTHAKVTKEWGKAQALTRQRSAAGTASAAKRERERNARSTDVAPPLVRNRRHLQSHLQEPVTPTSSGGENARGRATLIGADWIPKPETVTELRRGRPDLVGEHYDAELREFQLWCRSNAVTTHDPEASFLRFMHKAKVPAPQRESFDQRRIREAREAVQ